MKFKRISVLGMPIAEIDYEQAWAACERFAQKKGPSSIAAANTHLVAQARHCPHFAQDLSRFDLLLPDGMPLVWTLQWKGSLLRDRVYGPYFMRYVLEKTPTPWRHAFFGGSESTLKQLQQAITSFQPKIEMATMICPPFRPWTEEENLSFIKQIQKSRADFVWVALGGGRQERWISHNLHHFSHGLFCAVGNAFELLAGQQKFAPPWMQKRGLTWLYRLKQEPFRLAPRYFYFHTLFLYYTFQEIVTSLLSQMNQLYPKNK